jgi:hypothetical protein
VLNSFPVEHGSVTVSVHDSHFMNGAPKDFHLSKIGELLTTSSFGEKSPVYGRAMP